MSTHNQTAETFTDAATVTRALAALPQAISFLPADAAEFFVPVNSDESWTSGAGKRVLDLMIAVPLLIVLAPVLAVIAIAIRLQSNGPALFRQSRSGKSGRTFTILKFRTMTVAENGDTIVQARSGDARVTKLGAFLRRTSLDELPQLFNVVLGDMSLVGPRPHARAHDAFYGEKIADYGHRFAVKPGMTGWAQVQGLRGPTPQIADMAARIEADFWYVRHASFVLDLAILARTPLAVLRSRNAV